ncbi:MAG: hypothetical protein PF637_13650 [Spirochaetes bacterium]|jgi:predicted nucleotidyltransferase|nr:hypothetical protein [Spirochaetota bacterium]
MKTEKDIIKKQKHYVSSITEQVRTFVDGLDKKHIQTILLSGSVARGDYYPDKYGGMVDLTVMRVDAGKITAEELFGPDVEPEIPYHCVIRDGVVFQIWLDDFIDMEAFKKLDESAKYAIIESHMLFDRDNLYFDTCSAIKVFQARDLSEKCENCIGIINYLLSDYKKDRWYRRQAYVQMHENLNTAIKTAIKCLFYLNNKYVPAKDRRLYYSFGLKYLPENYEELINSVLKQDVCSEQDYIRREALFNSRFFSFITKNHQKFI